MSSAIKTPAFQAKASNILNEDNSSIYSGGEWSFKNASAVTGFHVDASGNVGIGTSSPLTFSTYKILDIRGTSGGWLNMGTASTSSFYMYTDGTNAAINTQTAGHLAFGTSNTERMRIDANGNVSIAGSTVTGKVTITQNSQSTYTQGLSFYFSNTSYWNIVNGAVNRLYFGFASGGGGYIDKAHVDASTGNWIPMSDERLKKNIEAISYGLKEIIKLKPVEYNIKEEEETAQKHLGFIAQEVLPVLPNVVSIPEDSEQMMGVSTTEIIPVLVKAIQELSAKVDAQAEEIKALKAQP